MRTLLQENKKLLQFLLICLAGYLSWFLIFNLWLSPGQEVDSWLSALEAKEIYNLLKFFGVNIDLVLENGYKYAFYINEKRTIGLANSCNGLFLFPLFSLFIMATPGIWRNKLYYVFAGCLAIYHVNIIRIIALIFVKQSYPSSLDFNHKYTFTVLVYAFIFLLWHLWIKHFSANTKNSTHA
jgi:exosortase family protein XrtF